MTARIVVAAVALATLLAGCATIPARHDGDGAVLTEASTAPPLSPVVSLAGPLPESPAAPQVLGSPEPGSRSVSPLPMGSSDPAAPPSTAAPPATASQGPAGPLQVAVDWLAAYRAASWDRPATGWIDAVAPYVTARLDAQNRRLAGAPVGAGWAQFVTRRCTTTLTDTGAVIPPEAPATDTLVHVQVAGTLRTACETGPPVPDEPATATVTVVATPVGWRVDAREQ